MKAAFRILAFAVVAALVVFACARAFPDGAFRLAHRLNNAPAEGLAYWLLGRSQCSLGQTTDGVRRDGWIRTEMEKVRTKCRLVSSEDEVELWETPSGSYWIPRGDAASLFFLLAEEATDIYSGSGGVAVQKGDVVLDCGAHIGMVTRRALEAGASQVVAIEPGHEALACLRRNLAKEIADGRVVVCPKGVWDKEDRLQLTHYGQQTISDSFVSPASGGERYWAQLTTIDRLVVDLKLAKVDFVKMDIEGAERNALRGARETMRRFRPRMSICVYHRPDDLEVIPQIALGAQPAFQMSCFRCTVRPDSWVRFDVAHFR